MRRASGGELVDIEAALRTLTLGDPPALQAQLEAIGRLVGADLAFAGTVLPCVDGPKAGFLYGPEPPRAEAAERFEALLADHPDGWGLWDAANPDPRQRNVVMTTRELRAVADLSRVPVFAELLPALGLDRAELLRVLVCDGATVLASVACFREGIWGEEERVRLARLVDPIRDRLAIERLLDGAPLATAMLDSLLDGLAAPAFVVGPRGEVAFANRAGRALWDRDRHRARAALRASLAGAGAGTRPFRLLGAGLPPHRVALLMDVRNDLDLRLMTAANRWALTPKQLEVVARLARGMCNKEIAAEVGCAESTVELHVTAILAKAECERRAELVARFWSGS